MHEIPKKNCEVHMKRQYNNMEPLELLTFVKMHSLEIFSITGDEVLSASPFSRVIMKPSFQLPSLYAHSS